MEERASVVLYAREDLKRRRSCTAFSGEYSINTFLQCHRYTNDVFRDLEKRIAKIPSSLEQAAQKVKQAEELSRNLTNLRKDYEDIHLFIFISFNVHLQVFFHDC